MTLAARDFESVSRATQVIEDVKRFLESAGMLPVVQARLGEILSRLVQFPADMTDAAEFEELPLDESEVPQ